MARKGKELTKQMLKELGFVDLIYDAKTDSYTLFRNWYENHHCNGKRLKTITICPEDQYHPYGEDFKSFRASFKCNGENYSISFNRFLWVWEKGYISENEIVKLNDGAKDHSIDSYHTQDYRDHDGWKRGNQYTWIDKRVDEFIKQYENGEESTALKWRRTK